MKGNNGYNPRYSSRRRHPEGKSVWQERSDERFVRFIAEIFFSSSFSFSRARTKRPIKLTGRAVNLKYPSLFYVREINGMHVRMREQNEAHRSISDVPFYITTVVVASPSLHTWHSYIPSSWTVTTRICSNQSVLEWITTNRLSTEWVLLPTVNNRLFFRFIHVIWNWKKFN